jgi:C-terminal processing protease CtpA/Prc
MRSSILSAALLALLAGCGGGPEADPEEITGVFRRHSCDSLDFGGLESGLREKGPSVLPRFDNYALFFPASWRPEPAVPGMRKANAGLVLWRVPGGARIARVYQGSPAEKAGLQAGDTALSLDGKPLDEVGDAALYQALYGLRGGAFELRGEKKAGGPFAAALKRDFGGMPLIWGFNVPGSRDGYLRVINFGAGSAEKLRREIGLLLDGGANRLVIDLRGNYGGSVAQVSECLALFAPRGGPVFRAVSRHPGYARIFTAQAPGPFAGIRTVLLTDAATVSRGELFAAALREWGGAAVVGETTGGNVSATRGFKLRNGGALRLTVARLQTPGGLDLEGRGLVPDVAAAAQRRDEGPGFTEFPMALASADRVLKTALSRY